MIHTVADELLKIRVSDIFVATAVKVRRIVLMKTMQWKRLLMEYAGKSFAIQHAAVVNYQLLLLMEGRGGREPTWQGSYEVIKCE